jgi:hypothetical protein
VRAAAKHLDESLYAALDLLTEAIFLMNAREEAADTFACVINVLLTAAREGNTMPSGPAAPAK